MKTPIIMILLLVVPYLLVWVAGRLSGRDLRTLGGLLGITCVFCFTGVGHFVKTEEMAAMMPQFVPARVPLVYITGVLEFLLAILVLVPKLRTVIGCTLLLMLAAFLPVNIHAAIHKAPMGGHAWGPVYLLIRIPLQLILGGWIWYFAIRRKSDAASA